MEEALLPLAHTPEDEGLLPVGSEPEPEPEPEPEMVELDDSGRVGLALELGEREEREEGERDEETLDSVRTPEAGYRAYSQPSPAVLPVVSCSNPATMHSDGTELFPIRRASMVLPLHLSRENSVLSLGCIKNCCLMLI